MSDLPYLMQDQVKDELWLVTSETRLLITPEIYDLLASNGAELPDAYGIKELREQNAKLRELVLCLLTCHSDDDSACDKCPVNGGSGIWEFEDFCDSLLERVHELRIEVTE